MNCHASQYLISARLKSNIRVEPIPNTTGYVEITSASPRSKVSSAIFSVNNSIVYSNNYKQCFISYLTIIIWVSSSICLLIFAIYTLPVVVIIEDYLQNVNIDRDFT